MTDLELFRMIAPEFSAVLDSDVAKWIILAASRIDEGYFANKYQIASIYLAAHFLKISTLDSTLGGAISSIKNGDMAESYAADNSHGMYGESSYGRLYSQLMSQMPGGSPVLLSIL